MSILLLAIVGLFGGLMVPRRWMLAVPTAIGAVALTSMAASGRSIADTPIPFLMVCATLAVGGGQFIRLRSPHSPTR